MTKRRLAVGTLMLAFALGNSPAAAGPVGDFFKRIGDAFAHPRHSAPPPKTGHGKSAKRSSLSSQPSASPQPEVAATKGGQAGAQPPANPAATPMPERRASSINSAQLTRADLPYGVPVPNRPGFVFSPFSPNGGYVDVRGFPSGTPVKDPYTGKFFLTP